LMTAKPRAHQNPRCWIAQPSRMIHHTDCDRSNALSRGGRERLHLRWVADNVAYEFLASA
jgi:hypothetical protein